MSGTLFGADPVMNALVGGIIIASFNLFGASLVLVWRNPSDRTLDVALGFAAGIMLAASFTSLIVPGIEVYSDGNPIPVLVGVAIGAAFLDRSDILIPHAHYLLSGRKRADAADPSESIPVRDERIAGVVLFVLAITIHNMPEGLAVGVGFGSGDLSNAIPLMLAIGIQNVPEGLAVSVAAINAGLNRRFYAVVAGIRSGVVEIPLAVIGAYAVQSMTTLLPYAMGFAAGAMLFVISDEIVPETHTRGNERVATLGTIAGIIIMIYLDVALG
ncbi:MAG: ZIP family metal transporter [Halanaeroarchaeum sp.]